jgi:DNA modification methylase
MQDKKWIMKSEVRLGNCYDIMNEYYGGQIDFVVTSPPYYNQKECAASGSTKMGEYRNIQEYFDDMLRIMEECYRLAKPGAIFAINIGSDPTFDLPSWFSMMLEQRVGLKYIDRIAWIKGSGNVVRGFHLEAHNCYYPFLAWEPIYIYHKGKAGEDAFPRFEERFKDTIGTLLRNNVWEIPQDNEALWHPAPFPRKLIVNLLMCYTPEGALILDPFGGAMTTAVAVNEVAGNRKYLCCELNESFYEQGIARINSTIFQDSLF